MASAMGLLLWFGVGTAGGAGGIAVGMDGTEFGFESVPLTDLRENDVLAMRVGSEIVNHVAVYIGDTMILHHVKDHLSARDVYGSFWRRATVKCLRYTK